MKKLGQYFLVNKERIRVILDALQVSSGDFLIEIGPGRGAITNQLKSITPTTRTGANNANKSDANIRIYANDTNEEGEKKKRGIEVVAIEKDETLADNLEKEMGSGITIIHGDALQELPRISEELGRAGRSYKVVGNIPYYITGRLFRILGDLRWKPELTVLMIQKEVAERVCAAPPKMSILSACVQFWAEPTIAGFVPRGDFSPKPKVDGGIVRLKLKNAIPMIRIHANDTNEEKEDEEAYYRLVRGLFKQPRKTVLNNFQSSEIHSKKSKEGARNILESAGIRPEDRPQNLSVQDILRLREKIKEVD